MLRRLVSRFSSSRSFAKSSQQRAVAQTPFFLSSRCSYSSPAQPDSPKGSGNLLPKVAIGTVVAGAAVAAAYQTGYLSNPQFKQEAPSTSQKAEFHVIPSEKGEFENHVPNTEVPDNIGKESPTNVSETTESNDSEDQSPVEDDSNALVSESLTVSEELPTLEKEESGQPVTSLDGLPQSEEGSVSEISSEESNPPVASLDELPQSKEGSASESKSSVDSPTDELNDSKLDLEPSKETILNDASINHQIPNEVSEDHIDAKVDTSPSSEVGSLEAEDKRPETPAHVEDPEVSLSLTGNKEVLHEGSEEPKAAHDQKIIIEFIDAIHAAEIRQAESDLRLFSTEKQKMKEKYEKELRDARARELMFAEEASILDKELNRERLKAEAEAKLLEEKAEENLRAEIQRKEEEMEFELNKMQELGKAELNAAIAKEKASHLEKMSEANLNIRALCMAFYARSEEARQNYSIHKLALGALTLENALSKGLPIKAEVDSLQSSIAGLDKDSLLDLVLSSLPEETLTDGTDTLLQLNQKFDSLKGTLRHFSLIPLGGGGMLAHAVAHFASAIKMREKKNKNGEGIESVISEVEGLLAEGNLAEAADVLERGVTGTEAEGAISEWVKLARHRAITEQAISLLQAYATSTSLT